MPLLAKISCLREVLKVGGGYELVEKLWSQFVLTTGRVNDKVEWTRDEVVASSITFRKITVFIPDLPCYFAFSQFQ